MSIDQFFQRTYNANTYNCAHFVSEVWEYLTGVDIREIMQGFLLPAKDRYVNLSIRKAFKRIRRPAHISIVLMRRPKAAPHVGIFYKGKVFQIERTGVSLMPLDIATMGFNKVSFYQC